MCIGLFLAPVIPSFKKYISSLLLLFIISILTLETVGSIAKAKIIGIANFSTFGVPLGKIILKTIKNADNLTKINITVKIIAESIIYPPKIS